MVYHSIGHIIVIDDKYRFLWQEATEQGGPLKRPEKNETQYHHCRWRAAKYKHMFGAEERFSREGCLSCHTYCDIRPRFFRSHPKDQFSLTTHKAMLRSYSYPDLLRWTSVYQIWSLMTKTCTCTCRICRGQENTLVFTKP
jgi:hypothetical protein